MSLDGERFGSISTTDSSSELLFPESAGRCRGNKGVFGTQGLKFSPVTSDFFNVN